MAPTNGGASTPATSTEADRERRQLRGRCDAGGQTRAGHDRRLCARPSTRMDRFLIKRPGFRRHTQRGYRPHLGRRALRTPSQPPLSPRRSVRTHQGRLLDERRRPYLSESAPVGPFGGERPGVAISYFRSFGKVSSWWRSHSRPRREDDCQAPGAYSAAVRAPTSALPGPTSLPLHQSAALRCPLAIS